MVVIEEMERQQRAAADKPYWDDKLGPGWEKRPFPAPTAPPGWFQTTPARRNKDIAGHE